MIIYMLGGKARSGKDMVANMIKRHFEKENKKCIILQISEYLKYYAEKVLNWDRTEDTKPRAFLQEIGTSIRQNKETFLIDRLVEDINILSSYCDAIVISDVRLPLEFKMVKEKFENVKNIHIVRDNFDNSLGNKSKHITEVALDNFNAYDYIIENNASLEKLEEKVNLMLKEEVL